MFGGLSWFDALTHSFSTIATGGFSNYNSSAAHFDSAYVDGIITFFMILAGINFNLYYLGVSHGIREITRDREFRTYISIIGISTALVTIHTYFSGVFSTIGESFRYSIFQCVSVLTTTGYCTADFDLWPAFTKMILFLLFFVGGCSSSTGGGIKVIRVLVVFKLIKRGILVRLHPNAIVKVKFKDRILSIDTVQSIAGFVFLYMFILTLTTVLITLGGHDFTTALHRCGIVDRKYRAWLQCCRSDYELRLFSGAYQAAAFICYDCRQTGDFYTANASFSAFLESKPLKSLSC